MAFTGAAEDRLAIRELLDAYADAVTRCDADDWAACWADESEWALPDYPEIGTVRGKVAILAMWVEAMKHYPGLMFEAWPGSIAVNGNATGVGSYTSEVDDQNGVTTRDRGVYDDVCVKIDGGWVFKSRIFRNIHRQ